MCVIKKEEAIKIINLKINCKASSIKMEAMRPWVHLAKKIRQSSKVIKLFLIYFYFSYYFFKRFN